MRKRVFVAGKYNDTDVVKVLANMRKGISASIEVLKAGMAPFCPWLDFQWGLVEDIGHREYKDVALAWLPVCDAMLVLPGWETSEGTKAEMEEARKHNIPIYHSVAALVDSPNMRDDESHKKCSGTISAILTTAKDLKQKVGVLAQARNLMQFFLTASFIEELLFGLDGIDARLGWLEEEKIKEATDLKILIREIRSGAVLLNKKTSYTKYQAAAQFLSEAEKGLSFIITQLENTKRKL